MTRCNHGPGSFVKDTIRDGIKQYTVESGPWRDDEVSGKTIDEGRECGLPFADDSDPGRCVIRCGWCATKKPIPRGSEHSFKTHGPRGCLRAGKMWLGRR